MKKYLIVIGTAVLVLMVGFSGCNEIKNNPPVVHIFSDKTDGKIPLKINFSCNATDLDGEIISYYWTFGDGGTSTKQNLAYFYKKSGNYKVTLIVSDDDGLKNVDYLYIIANKSEYLEENKTDNESSNDNFDNDFENIEFDSFSEAVNYLDTPSKIINFMKNKFETKFHDDCTSYKPSRFFEIRKGDCKDYSTFFSYILDYHGYYAEIVTFRYYDYGGDIHGHVVTLFEDNDGLLYYQSNLGICGPVSSVDDVLEMEKISCGADVITNYRIKSAGSTNCCCPD